MIMLQDLCGSRVNIFLFLKGSLSFQSCRNLMRCWGETAAELLQHDSADRGFGQGRCDRGSRQGARCQVFVLPASPVLYFYEICFSISQSLDSPT